MMYIIPNANARAGSLLGVPAAPRPSLHCYWNNSPPLVLSVGLPARTAERASGTPKWGSAKYQIYNFPDLGRRALDRFPVTLAGWLHGKIK
jgi:hypothetical protein